MPLAYGLIHPVDLALHSLPPKLQGLRIAHLSDLHIRRRRRRHDMLIRQLTSTKLRLMLAHYPSWLPTAADMNVDLLFAGHTHGGQIRLPNGLTFNNACDLPRHLSSGILRHRDTLIAISRGLGEVGIPAINKWRLFCPPHVPIYTLRKGSTLGVPTQGLMRVVRW